MRILPYILYLCLVILQSGCNNNDEAAIYFSLSTDTMQVSDKSCIKEITITTNSDWNVISELPAWLSVSSENGSRGQSIVRLSVSRNDSEEGRSCNIIFSYGNRQHTLSVFQRSVEILRFSSPKEHKVEATDTIVTIDVKQNIGYNITCQEACDWIEIEGYKDSSANNLADDRWSNKFELYIKKNVTGRKRSAGIIVYNRYYNLSDTLLIIQNGGTKSHYDGEWVQLQTARKGHVNLIILGDGFTQEELAPAGKYECAMQQAMEYFFSIEPFTSYRDYFNVYMVVAESEQAGVGIKGAITPVKNKFGSVYGNGTEINCRSERCFEYAAKVDVLPEGTPLTVIVVLNDNKYAGTTYLYSNGNSLALCPMSNHPSPNDFEGLIHHEAGGHGFGFLCDEYIYYDQPVPETRKQEIKEWQKLGFQQNLDFTGNVSAVLWKDFIGMKKYDPVGAYEGGYEYRYGVWRSEENSCMNNNIPYYNVQSRWCIVKRIMALSDLDYSVHDFINDDHPVYQLQAQSIATAFSRFEPLGSPIWIKNK